LVTRRHPRFARHAPPPRINAKIESHLRFVGQAEGVCLVAVGALSERLRPAVWAKVGEAIVDAMHGRHAAVEARVTESVGAWRAFEADIREDSGAHFAGGK
jgi:hypothetical protein